MERSDSAHACSNCLYYRRYILTVLRTFAIAISFKYMSQNFLEILTMYSSMCIKIRTEIKLYARIINFCESVQ